MPRNKMVDLVKIKGIHVVQFLDKLDIVCSVHGVRSYPITELKGKNILQDVLTMLDEMKAEIDKIARRVKGRAHGKR